MAFHLRYTVDRSMLAWQLVSQATGVALLASGVEPGSGDAPFFIGPGTVSFAPAQMILNLQEPTAGRYVEGNEVIGRCGSLPFRTKSGEELDLQVT